jgi:hypothetical protein
MWYGSEIFASIDYDDVNHPAVRKIARKMVKILNEHWDEKYNE